MPPWILPIGAWVFSGLAAANLFFIKRLIIKIDKVDSIESMLERNHSQVQEQVSGLKSQVNELSHRVRDVTDLKSEVAVLRYAFQSLTKTAGQAIMDSRE